MTALRVVRCLPDGFLAGALRADARAGLTATPKVLPPKWFYDERGSELFEKITRLDEYYPTRAERSILRAAAGQIAAGTRARTLVELGAGAADKTRLLLDALAGAGTLASFVPVDVSETALIEAARRVAGEYPGLAVTAVVSDFEEHLGLPSGSEARLVVFLGGTIGNLLPGQRAAFLRSLRSRLRPGDAFLLGTDLVKDPAVLVAAYDDAAGVTAAFNKNILSVLNAALGADFDPDAFEHVALWDAGAEWIEMRLRSLQPQRVTLPAIDLQVTFGEGEELRTEVSAKFRRERVAAELAAAGFTMAGWWTDEQGRFGLSLSVPAERGPHGRRGSVAGRAAFHPPHPGIGEPQLGDQLGGDPLGRDRPAAEQVHRDQVLLRPGVNGQVRLGQDQHQGNRTVGEDHVAGVEHGAAAGLHRGARGGGQFRDIGHR